MAKKAKKREVKSGTKSGPYRKTKPRPTTWQGKPTTLTEMDLAMNYVKPAEIKTPKSFADCMFEIINSNMEQSAKMAAFEALKEAAKTEVVKAY